MNKRIIDGMSAQEISTGWDYSHEDILDYLESICKPAPSWTDDVSEETPVLCWVSDSPIPEAACTNLSEYVDHVTEINEKGYIATAGFCYKYATPISPNDIWQPTQKGDTK